MPIETKKLVRDKKNGAFQFLFQICRQLLNQYFATSLVLSLAAINCKGAAGALKPKVYFV